MRIEHAAMYVADLETMRNFFCRYFGYYESVVLDPEHNRIEITV